MRYVIVVENYRGDVRASVWESATSARGVQSYSRVWPWADLAAARRWVRRAAEVLSEDGSSVETVDYLVH